MSLEGEEDGVIEGAVEVSTSETVSLVGERVGSTEATAPVGEVVFPFNVSLVDKAVGSAVLLEALGVMVGTDEEELPIVSFEGNIELGSGVVLPLWGAIVGAEEEEMLINVGCTVELELLLGAIVGYIEVTFVSLPYVVSLNG